MPWVRFTERFNYHVRPNLTIAYKSNYEGLVKIACADEAVRLGKAVYIERPVDRKADKYGTPGR